MDDRYIEINGQLTEQLCHEKSIDMVQLQQSLEYFESNTDFQVSSFILQFEIKSARHENPLCTRPLCRI